VSDSGMVNGAGLLPADILITSGNRLEGKVHAAQKASGDARKRELKEVAQEFEAVFIAQILKVMRETIDESGLMEGGAGKSIYTELFDQEVALSLARRGALGISDLLYENLSDTVAGEKSESGSTESSQTSPVLPEFVGASSTNAMPKASGLKLPVEGTLTSGFGFRRDPFSQRMRFHKGVDIAAPEGSKVVAAMAGEVISAGFEKGYGNMVLVKHAGGLQTRYGHLREISVKVGDRVAAGSLIGAIGSTGRSTGPHLHFEVIRMGQLVNPVSIFSFQIPSAGQESNSERQLANPERALGS